MNAKEFGALIQKKRKEKNMTQSQLANHLHVSRTAVSKWETGVNCPDASILEELSALLGLPAPEPAERSMAKNNCSLFQTVKQRIGSKKIFAAALSGVMLLAIAMTALIIFFSCQKPEFIVLDNFHADYEDIPSCCFIIESRTFDETAWNTYCYSLAHDYFACMEETQSYVMAYFQKYDAQTDTIASADYITILYSNCPVF